MQAEENGNVWVVTGKAEKRSADTHPVQQRSGVKYERKHKRSRPQSFASLWELQLQEPVETKSRRADQ